MSVAKTNDTVRVHYTGKLTSGEIFDTSVDRDPLEFTIGAGQLIKGFDDGVVGMKINEKKTLEIPSDEAYGPVHDQLIQEVEKSQLPPEIEPQIGQTLIATGAEGQETRLVIKDINDQNIVVDANHPLAGKDLIFDIQLVEIV